MTRVGAPVEIIVHVPAVHIEPWRLLDPHPAQRRMLAMPSPMPIGIRVETPARLLALERPRDQLAVLGGAMLSALESMKPRFHIARASGAHLFESGGTTIMVTGYDATGRHVIFATWDLGETVDAALQRLAEARRIARLPVRVAGALYDRSRVAELPPPQLVLSNCVPLGIDDPTTTLGGYDAGGAEVPMTLAVGRRSMHLVVDHRVFNPPDEVALLWGAGTAQAPGEGSFLAALGAALVKGG